MPYAQFPVTKAYAKIYKFVLAVDTCVRKELQFTNDRIAALLTRIDEMIADTVLDTKKDRFANPALKNFHATLQSVETGLDGEVYLKSAFGNAIRLDYGTGHELNFLCFVYVLTCQKIVRLNEVLLTMKQYFEVVRHMILKFNVEPAGSHGLWGLDDFQFLPFLLGSSELHNSPCVLDNLKESCYKDAIEFIKTTKGKGNVLLEHVAPKLYGMRSLRWSEINAKLFRMYIEDVLRSEVVYQHFIYTRHLEDEAA